MEAEEDNLADESIAVVSECVDHLQKLVKLKSGCSLSSYIGSMKNLLRAVTSKEKAMKHFVSSSVGGVPLIVSVLELSQDQHMKHIAIMIMKEMLSRKAVCSERTQLLISSGAVNHLLKLVVKSQTPVNISDECMAALYDVLAKIGKKDKKFATKARLLGVLPVLVAHLRFYILRPKVLNSVLLFLKRVLSSPMNCSHLSKAGLIPQLLAFLEPPKKKLTMSAMYALEAISVATRSRYAARQFVKQDVTSHLLQMLFNPNYWPGSGRTKTNRIFRAFNAALNTLVHLTEIKSGREALCSSDIVSSLLNWSYTLTTLPGEQWDGMVSCVSLIIQRCLPPRPLPVQKFNSPVLFILPEKRFSDEPCNSGINVVETRNISDSDSLVSSNLSSVDSDRDSDQDNDPFTDHIGLCSSESIRQCKMFFEELKETKQLKVKNSSEMSDDAGRHKELLLSVSVDSKLSQKTDLSTCENTVAYLDANGSLNNELHNKCDNQQKDQSPVISTEDFTVYSNHNNLSTCDSAEINMCAASNNGIDVGVKKSCAFTTSEVRNLINSAKEESRSQRFQENVNMTEIYYSHAAKIVSVIPFIKVAYPDAKTLNCSTPLEKLYCPHVGLLKNEIFKHTEEMTRKDLTFQEIYNLDKLIAENVSHTASLSNTDEKRIFSTSKTCHLSFESRFESGNLRKVFWKGGVEYDLILSPDINTSSHHQWFYFEVSGMEANVQYIFNIINMEKPSSLFSDGMCPVMFSVKNHVKNQIGWIRTGTDICYYRNHYLQGFSKQSVLCDKPYYTLTFTIAFPYDNDVCYLAYHYPYTFSALQTHIYWWLNSYDTTSIYCKKDELCKTLSGNSVPVLTITAKPVDNNRPYIFLSARVHPGESNSSWAMKGSLDFLFSNKPSAQRLREMFIFKVIPMLNPDGVINGCHRCSLSGQDLNRQWITPNPKLHPTIFHAKALLHYLNFLGRRPLVFCDYHGHSRRRNVFLYGCNPEESWWISDETKHDCESYKLIPILMHHMAPAFSLDYCCFRVERNRESTARITVWRQFDVALSYTMESSFGGCDQGLYAGYHIGISQLEETGTKLCQCFGKLVLSPDSPDTLGCAMPIDTTMLNKIKKMRTQETKHLYSSSSSLSEEDNAEYDDSEK